MRRRRVTTWLCLGVLGTMSAMAQSGSEGRPSSPQAQQRQGTVPAADQKFVKQAIDAAMTELQMSKSAEAKSTNEDVKKFAQTVIEDRSDTLEDLRQAAQQMGVEPPREMSDSFEKSYDKLTAMSGVAFDQEYMKAMVKMHKDDDHLYREEAKNTTSPQLKKMMTEADARVQERLQQAQPLAQEVNGRAGTR